MFIRLNFDILTSFGAGADVGNRNPEKIGNEIEVVFAVFRQIVEFFYLIDLLYPPGEAPINRSQFCQFAVATLNIGYFFAVQSVTDTYFNFFQSGKDVYFGNCNSVCFC